MQTLKTILNKDTFEQKASLYEDLTKNPKIPSQILLFSLVIGLLTTCFMNTTTGYAAPVAAPTNLTVKPGDTSVWASWSPSPDGAVTGYTLQLIKGNNVMQEATVPASQTRWNGQGLWDGTYQVRVWANSPAGTSDIVTSNGFQRGSVRELKGFFDKCNIAEGGVNANLWDITFMNNSTTASDKVFANNQKHCHTELNNGTGVTMRSRMSMDFSGGRTAYVSGEVDLKSFDQNWFEVVLNPYILNAEQMYGEDRDQMKDVPQLAFIAQHGKLILRYMPGGGRDDQTLAEFPYKGINNVRDFVQMWVSQNHVKVALNDLTIMDVPANLGFESAYLYLRQREYNIDADSNPALAKNATWHLDNWGFEVNTSGYMPTPRLYVNDGCLNANLSAPFECSTLFFKGTGEYGTAPGIVQGQNFTVNGSDGLSQARLLYEVDTLSDPRALKIRVNGSDWFTPPAPPNYQNAYYFWMEGVLDINPALLRNGSNQIEFMKSYNPAGNDGFNIQNARLEVVYNRPYVAPAEPPEPAPIKTLSSVPGTPPSASQLISTVDPAFYATWQASDASVLLGTVNRSWLWGPTSFDSKTESYAQSPGGQRVVQYFDKARMEINNPAGDRNSLYFVTNGLLPKELISGQMQIGDNEYKFMGAAQVNVAGDPNGSVTYAAMRGVVTLQPGQNTAPNRTGQNVTSFINRSGTVSQTGAIAGVKLAQFVPQTGHNLPNVFVTYFGTLPQDWVYVMGLPLSEPYITTITLNGRETTAMVQVFERRVLTYTPGNADPFKVEQGNVGQHYYNWRYGSQQFLPAEACCCC